MQVVNPTTNEEVYVDEDTAFRVTTLVFDIATKSVALSSHQATLSELLEQLPVQMNGYSPTLVKSDLVRWTVEGRMRDITVVKMVKNGVQAKEFFTKNDLKRLTAKFKDVACINPFVAQAGIDIAKRGYADRMTYTGLDMSHIDNVTLQELRP